MTVQRFDRSAFSKPVKTPAGFLRCEAYLTRAGIFTYKDAAGNTVKELRKPSEVFAGKSISTLTMAPLCDDHPSERVDSTNAKKYSVGSVGTDLEKDGDFLRGSVMVTDQATIDKVEKEDKQELSCGYTCEVDPTPGTWNGEHYDAVQKNIVYNHLALVSVGRAGPDVKLRLDSAAMVDEPQGKLSMTEAEIKDLKAENARLRADSAKPVKEVESENSDTSETAGTKGGAGAPAQKTKMMKIGDKDFDVPQKLADAMEEWMKDAGTMLGKTMLEKDASKAKSDAKDDEIKKLRVQLSNPEKLQEAVRARVALEKNAFRVLGDDIKTDSMSDDEIKKAIVLKVSPEAKLDAVSDIYLQGRYDAAVESASTNTFASFARNVSSASPKTEDKFDAADAKKRFLERSQNAWKTDTVNGVTKKQITGAKA